MSQSPARLRKPATPRTAYLVLGMHRSGTSAVTQLLALAGAALPANLMPGDEHNQKGYFEPWKIALFNDERLRAAGSAWDDPFAFPYRPLPAESEDDWVRRAKALFAEEYGRKTFPLMKDPRATVLLPFWLRVLGELDIGARPVIAIRHPLAVAGSLRRRDQFSDEKSVLVWTAYMLAAETYTRGLARAFTDYDALLADWRAEARRIEAAHGAPLPALTEAAGKRIDGFLSPDLRHNAGDAGLARLGWAGELAAAVHAWFAAAARGAAPESRMLDEASAELSRRAGEFGPLVSPAARDLDVARAKLAEARARVQVLEQLEAELRAELENQRRVMETGWQADVARLEAVLQAERETMVAAGDQLDAALLDD